MSSYFALWRAILHVPISPLPLQNIVYSLSYVQRTLCHCERKYGDPAGYCVLAGKRNKQAKDKHFRFLRKMIGQKRSLWRVPCNALNVIAKHCPLLHSVQRTLCHCERSAAISRKGTLFIKPTQDTFVLAWRKRRTQAKEWALLLAIMWFQKRSLRRIARKGHRIANPTQDTFVLAWRKGAHNQKSEHYCLQ